MLIPFFKSLESITYRGKTGQVVKAKINRSLACFVYNNRGKETFHTWWDQTLTDADREMIQNAAEKGEGFTLPIKHYFNKEKVLQAVILTKGTLSTMGCVKGDKSRKKVPKDVEPDKLHCAAKVAQKLFDMLGMHEGARVSHLIDDYDALAGYSREGKLLVQTCPVKFKYKTKPQQ